MQTLLLISSDTGGFPLPAKDFRIITAHTNSDGLAQARRHTPDAIVCLVDAASEPGDLLRDLQADPALAGIPLIVVADHMSYDDSRRWMEAGADDCLPADSLPEGLSRAIHARLVKRAAVRGQYARAMDTLRYTIATAMPHEFRTALSGILGFSSMLREDCAQLHAAEIRDMAGYIAQSAERMQRQVESYTWYARLRTQELGGESGIVTKGPTCETPAEIVETVAWQHAETADRVGDLSVEVGNAPVKVFGDYVQKIVSEVIDNAFKFSNPGTSVSVHTSINGDYSVLVRDHGRGMTAEQIGQVGAYMQFNRQVHEQQGAGMGLTIAKGLALLYGGDVTLESAPGEGTTARVTLPLAKSKTD